MEKYNLSGKHFDTYGVETDWPQIITPDIEEEHVLNAEFACP